MTLISKIAFAVALATTLHSTSYAEPTAQSMRQSGQAEEGSDGYLHAKSSDPEVVKAVKAINAKRREKYEQIARKNNQSVDAVAREAAQKLKKK